MKENSRDPNNKFMKIEEIIAMDIPLLTPIEVGMSPHTQNDIDRGDISETILVYYAGVGNSINYDTLQYYKRLMNGKPVDSEQGIMLPLIDYIKPLRS
ncbi:hypothetical protein KAI32_03755 [Candidatus Pacearchaeota archaeon]|nr:hypothetical protein [Candidatus Pacearchaeota archaeon]